jgi:aspartate/methionine/tyrosine aminotransferase
MTLRFHAPYMEWAKTRPQATNDLAISNLLACTLEDLPDAHAALGLAGRNDNGYLPLLEAIATRYGVRTDQVTTAQGTSGANFLVCAALLDPGDEVVVESPGYDPLLGAPRLLGAGVQRFERLFEEGWRLDPLRVERALTARTRLVVVTRPHNPSGVLMDVEALKAVGRLAAARGAHVLVDEVYLDATDEHAIPAARLGDEFISTSSLTKSYGLAGLRCGWVLSSAEVAARLRRARDVVDGTGPIVTERLSVVAFQNLDRLIARARGILEPNRVLVEAFLRSRPELRYVTPAGGTVVFPRLETTSNTDRFADRLLAERGTAVVPGHFFEAPTHFRIGFSGDADTLRAGLAAIGAALDERAW